MRHLPEFEGEQPRALWTSISGTITDESSQPPDVFHIGEQFVMVVNAEIIGVKHSRKSDDHKNRVLTRQHIVSVTEAHLVDNDVLRDARIATDERRIALSGEGRLDFTAPDPEPEVEVENPYDGAAPDLEMLALGAGDGERIEPDVDEILDVDPETGEIIGRVAVIPLTAKQRGALVMLAMHESAEPPRRVRQSNKTECSVAAHMSSTGVCTIYWQHVANLVEKGYAEIGYSQIDGAGADFVTITDAGAARALLEIHAEREGDQ